MTDEQYRQEARFLWVNDVPLDVALGAVVSRGSGRGAHVQAWVWIEDDSLPEGVGSKDDPNAA